MEIIITNNDLTCLLSCWNKARIFVKLLLLLLLPAASQPKNLKKQICDILWH